MPDFSLENQYGGMVAGVDEVGRGSWAGPVVSAAIIIARSAFPKDLLAQINDSKLLTALKRNRIYDALCQLRGTACEFSIAQASVEEVDRLNVREASLLSMQRAVEALPEAPEVTLVDGNVVPKLKCQAVAVIQGDSASISIAAASIVAKVFRDNLMKDLSMLHPHYSWESNVGYGTKAHQLALAKFGVTAHHRRSFAPIKKIAFAV